MTIPDELVQAAAEAMHIRSIHGECECGHKTIDPVRAKEHNARIALQAAFAKLPECEVPCLSRTDGQLCRKPPHPVCLISALAREFGGQE